MSKEITYQVPAEAVQPNIHEMSHYRDRDTHSQDRLAVTRDAFLGGAREAVQAAHAPNIEQAPEVIDFRSTQERALELTDDLMMARYEAAHKEAA